MYTALAVFIVSFLGILGYVALRSRELQRGERFLEPVRAVLDRWAERLFARLSKIPPYTQRIVRVLWILTKRKIIRLLARFVAVLYNAWERSRAFLWGRTQRLRSSKAASHFLSQVAEHKRRIAEEQKRDTS